MSNSKTKAKEFAYQLAEGGSLKEGSEFQGLDDALLNRNLSENNLTNAPSDVHYIGIYRQEQRNGLVSYRRDPMQVDRFPFWADIDEIPPKVLGSTRVALFGESVARGYFFEPTYSCAKVLSSYLNQNHSNDVEVLDLAMSGIGFAELRDTIMRSFVLEPDLVIIFAGNNLTIYDDILTEEDFRILSSIIEENPSTISGDIKEVIEKRFEKIIIDFLTQVVGEASRRSIPVVFILPEFNLLDWRSKTCYDRCVIWPDEKVEDIFRLIKSGEKALAERRSTDLFTIGNELIRLAPMLPFGYELLAENYLVNAENALAKEYLIKAKDCGIFRIGLMARIFSITWATLIDWVNSTTLGNVCIVDLSEVLKSHSALLIPGRSTFMDYCHLTFDGIKIAMEEVSQVVSKVLDLSRVEDNVEIKVDRLALAKAHFCAALHCAHYGPQTHLLEYHCRKAIENDVVAITWMEWYLDLTVRNMPWDINPSYGELLKAGISKSYEGGIQLFQLHELLDIELTQAMLKVVEPFKPGITVKIETLRNENYGLKMDGMLDLLRPCFSKKSYIDYDFSAFYFQAFDLISTFVFLLKERFESGLYITCRIPLDEADEEIEVFLNEESIGRFSIHNRWQTVYVEIPLHRQTRGMNVIQIKWPWGPRRLAERARKQLESDKAYVMRTYQPIYGEITSLKIEGSRKGFRRNKLLTKTH